MVGPSNLGDDSLPGYGKPKRVKAARKVKSWWCQSCSQEVYALRCKYCGKSEAEES